MKTPTQRQFKKVINNFENVLKVRPDAEVAMSKGTIRHDAMCHAAWYGYACGLREHGIFWDGASLLAKHLGFKDHYELNIWAMKNPMIWGNNNGGFMFCASCAFTDSDKSVTKLSEIVEHWKKVKERAEPYDKGWFSNLFS